MTATLINIEPITLQQKIRERRARIEMAELARSRGLIVFNPDTDPDTCERVRGLSDEVIHAEEADRMRGFTVEHFADLTMRGLEVDENHYSYARDAF